MWKPFGPKNGVLLNLFGPGTLQIGGERAAILVCYEQLLVLPILQSAAERATILIGVASHHWTKHTSIPAVQGSCLRAWSRLFNLPIVTAANT